MKKINSEIKIANNSLFSITMGTSNKKSPNVIYSVLNSYITPLNEEINEDLFLSLEKNIKKQLKPLLHTNNICEKNVIVVSEIASNRMIYGKQSYLDIQIYLKPTTETLLSQTYNFKKISTDIYNTYIKTIVKYIEGVIISNGFLLSPFKNKTAKKTIY